ncbi:hypothetical protein DFH09DRAFT_1146218 [Mycena vulgaris]|nr:hypothetical protein DFH09DRAFT_1146218 [Mycena vulgaris]
MFFTKSFLAAAMLVGTASAFTGTANLGFTGVASCDCPASNGPFAIAVPAALFGTAVCCNDAVTVTYNGKSVVAILSGRYTAGDGTQNVALSDVAFAMLEDNSGQTSLSPATWSFN